MLSLLSAEAAKLTRHKATWFLVWVYPIVFLALFVIGMLVGLAEGSAPAQPQSADDWIEDTVMGWVLPTHAVGRILISAFVAVVFAGEYGWNTWKLIVPHRSRAMLIASKYLLVIGLLLTAYVLAALVATGMSLADDILTGDAIPADLTAALVLEAQGTSALRALAPLLFTIAYTSLAAILTRSTIAALVIGIVTVVAEQAFVNFGFMLALRMPGTIWFLYHALPGYHVANLAEWIGQGAAHSTNFPDGRVLALSWGVSLAAAAAWTAALTAATFLAFRRQDLN
jgi:hypothetical protein